MTTETFQEITDRLKERLHSKLANQPHLSPEEYQAAIQRVAARDYNGLCRFDCPVCGGVGFVKVNPDAQVGEPEFGKIRHCPNVDLTTIYGDSLGLEPDEIRNLKWEDIRSVPLHNAIQSAETVKVFLTRGSGWITLWGGWGVAKSLILRIAIAESLRAGKMGAFVEMADMLEDLRGAYDAKNSNAEAEQRLEKWENIPILAVDELDKINLTDWAKEKNFSIFNARYQQAIRGKSLTIFASNSRPEKIGGALGDRMLDGRFAVIELKGDSNRPKIENQDY